MLNALARYGTDRSVPLPEPRRRLRSAVVDTLLTIMILGAGAFLCFKALELRDQAAGLRRQLQIARTEGTRLQGDLEISRDLMLLPGKRVPFSDYLDSTGAPHWTLLLVFNPTVCGHRLQAALTILARSRRTSRLASLPVTAFIGLDGAEDQEWTLSLRRSGLLPFPFFYFTSSKLANQFPLRGKKQFSQDPLFILVDPARQVRTVLIGADEARLKIWLEGVTKAFG